MGWRIEKGGGTCDADQWGVINTDTDETEGCHATEEEAQAQVDELEGAGSDDDDLSVADELGLSAADVGEALMADGAPFGHARVIHLGRRYADTRTINIEAARGVLARFRITNITAAGEAGPGRFELIAVPEGVRSEDDREIAEGALTTRPLPLPMMMMTVESMWGHEGAELAGRIDTLERVDSEWRGLGTYSSLEVGQRMRALVDEQVLRFVSADILATALEYVEEGTCLDWDDLFEGRCHIIERILAGSIMAATACPMPAFPQCVVVPEGTEIPEAQENGRGVAAALAAANVFAGSPSCHPGGGCCDSCATTPITASGYELPEAIPAEWFDDPSELLAQLPAGVRKHVTPDGRVYGWLADFETSHTGNPTADIRAPRSPSGYAYFCTGSLRARDASGAEVHVPVGQLTMGTGHPDNLRMPAMAAKAHYDGGPGAVQVCDVTVGENDAGIWFAGALRPGITDDQLRTFLATDESGDWRPVAGHLELVAIASGVAVPGFPIVHRGLAASGAIQVHTVRPRAVVEGGRVVALVAAGMRPADPVAFRLSRLEARLNRELAAIRDSVAPLMPLAVTNLRERRERAVATNGS